MRLALGVIALAACTYGHKDDVTGTGPDGGSPNPQVTLGAFVVVPGLQMPVPRRLFATVATKTSLYAIGGEGITTVTGEVDRAAIGADDSLSAFASAGNLVLPRVGHAAIILGDFLYVIGGAIQEGTMPDATIERATIRSDGSLTAFQKLPGGIVHPRYAHTLAVIGSSLYVIGGFDGANVADVERAPIAPDNTLGMFTIVPGVTQPRAGHTSNVVASSLYVIGGGSDLSTIDTAAITGNTTGPFTTMPNVALMPGRSGHASVVVGDSLFVIGGFNSAIGPTTAVEQGTFTPGGELGPLASLSITENRFQHTATVIGNSIYVIGGTDATQQPLATVERALLSR